ncbi:MAG: hypothetical protein ABS36_14725 [Acidobacteria bacterium SCN 69-37]|nr:MAG: hypothetical protein ABS36_14725 [Acidobacteria bacterium SCN 69-37]
MPFIRYTRDKRGYETTYVMHGYRPVQGPQRTRVLYLFRSPSHVRMGRRPLDEEAREALEHTHPDLSFDWTVLGRESESVRVVEDREPGRARRGGARSARPASSSTSAAVDDQSPLGRALGSETAARFRTRYRDLLQRIVRRARTPEERDRLTEAAQRLNPDDWPDAEAIRAHAETIEQEWDAVAAELPARRRGRRGGRRREGGADTPGSDDGADRGADEADPSDIMAGEGDVDERQYDLDPADADPAGGPGADAGGDRAGADDRAAEHHVPGDDEFRPD